MKEPTVGSFIELNDTLQISTDQGFPAELDVAKHLRKPIELSEFSGRQFTFTNKPGIRNYHQPPVRVFFVQNLSGKWVYWGLIEVLSVTHDYVRQQTSGIYTLTYLNNPDEMKQAFNLIDRRAGFDYFVAAGKRA
jgi:hypothetical protein